MFNYRQNRINNPSEIDLEYIDSELQDSKHVIVQFSEATYSNAMLSQLNMLCEKYDSNFGIRFHSFNFKSFDFKTLLSIPHVKCLYVDCLSSAENLWVLGELNHLQKLSLGVFELKDTEILSFNNLKKINELILTETRTKALNLYYLKDYKYLKLLVIGGHTKNIDSVGEISTLEHLSLNSVKKVPISFINKLTSIKTLRLILGGRENINEIKENNIEELEITWVRGFNDLGNISNFKNLKKLHIEDNIQLKSIEFKTELKHLTILRILNCKSLESLSGLDNLTALNEICVSKTNLKFESFIKQDFPKKLNTLVFLTEKSKTDTQIKDRIRDMGYKTR